MPRTERLSQETEDAILSRSERASYIAAQVFCIDGGVI